MIPAAANSPAEVPVQQGLARCPICRDYVQMAVEDGVIVIYRACRHYIDSWSELNKVTATFRTE